MFLFRWFKNTVTEVHIHNVKNEFSHKYLSQIFYLNQAGSSTRKTRTRGWYPKKTTITKCLPVWDNSLKHWTAGEVCNLTSVFSTDTVTARPSILPIKSNWPQTLDQAEATGQFCTLITHTHSRYCGLCFTINMDSEQREENLFQCVFVTLEAGLTETSEELMWS